jgi:hypothetical protein
MTIWTLTVHRSGGVRRIIGTSPTAARAQADALRAISSVNAATGFDHPRYEATVDGQITAIVATGVEHTGLPDHRGIADLLHHLEYAADPFPSF